MINGEWKLGYKPKKRVPAEEFLKPQGRFRHLLKGETGKKVIEDFQKDIDEEWEYVLKRCGETWDPSHDRSEVFVSFFLDQRQYQRYNVRRLRDVAQPG